MSKIICDVCGTAYPETAEKCPICGSARTSRERPAPQTKAKTKSAAPEETGYHYVRGGRFSKSNVKKRARSAQQEPVPESGAQQPAPEKTPKEGSNRGLVITAVVLLLAIVAMAAFLYLRFFWDGGTKKPTVQQPSTSQQPTGDTTGTEQPSTQPSTEAGTACTGLQVKETQITLDAAGRAWLLEVTKTPADTTDPLTFATSNDRVVTVSEQGRVTAVGPGEAVITVSCGTHSAQVRVVCSWSEGTSEPTNPSDTTGPEETTDSGSGSGTLSLNRSDITFFSKGESFRFEPDGLSTAQITWSVGNAAVATVSNGTVTAVGPGTTTVTAQYNGQRATCIIRCSFDGESGETTASTGTAGGSYAISHEDVTIAVGESFSLSLSDGSGSSVSVSWSSANDGVASVSGSTVTGVSSGTTTVSGTYNGKTYSCIVRVG